MPPPILRARTAHSWPRPRQSSCTTRCSPPTRSPADPPAWCLVASRTDPGADLRRGRSRADISPPVVERLRRLVAAGDLTSHRYRVHWSVKIHLIRLASNVWIFAARVGPTTPNRPQGLPLALCGLDRL